jgi:beta-glucosidase
MKLQSVVQVMCFTTVLAGLACGDNNRLTPVNPVSPSGLSYAQADIVATQGVAITPNMPRVTGTVAAWSVSPALPNGLNLGSADGVISGTPIAISPRAAYTITASNSAGSTDATIAITVNAKASACRDIPDLPAATTAWPALAPAILPDPAMEAQIAEIVGKMTLAEKVGQMVQGEIAGTAPSDVSQFFLGSMLNGGGSWPAGARHTAAQTWRATADAYFDASPSVNGVKIPVLWGIDAVHGNNNVYGATIFPHNIGLGAAHDACLVEQIGAATAAQVRATGQDWAFGPTLAVVRDDRWGRTYEGYSEAPAIVRWYGEAAFRGFEGFDPDGKHLHGVLATAKHFLGDGGTTNGVDQGNNQHSESDLINIFGQGYFGALGPGGGQTVMISFNSWNSGTGDHPAEGKIHGSKYLVTDVLKTKMGFDGLTVTDWNGHGQVAGCTNADCPRAVNAGIDLFMIPSRADLIAFITNTIAEVALPASDPKHIPEERINDAVTRILRVKARAGLLGSTVKPSQRANANDAALLHRDLARKAVRESLVLLKNDGGVLPLALPTTKKLLVVGNGIDSFATQTGGWTISWQGADVTNADFPAGVGDTILAGIQAAVGAGKVDAFATAAAITAANPDFSQYAAVIAVVGETPYAEGSGDITASMTLGKESKYPATEVQAVLAAVTGHDVPVVTVLLSGRPLWVNKEINRSNAFVAAFLPGTEGAGVADVLFKKSDGSVNFDFSGKLSYSWPKTDCQTPLNVGDASYDPLFAYGYGLTYASTTTVAPLDEAASAAGCGQGTVTGTVLNVHNNTGAIDPYNLYLGAAGPPDDYNQLVESPGTSLNATVASAGNHMTVTGSSTLTVDLQGDGRRAVWAGDGFAQIYMQALASADLSTFLKNDGALVFRGILNAATTAALTAQFTCEYPCRGIVDITGLLGAPGEKTTFKIPLSCFVPADAAGLDFTKVNAPFQLQTTQALDFTFAEVRWVQGAANDPDAADCPTPGVATPAPVGGKTRTFLSEDDVLLAPYILYLGSQADYSVEVEGGGMPVLNGTAHTAEPDPPFLMTLTAGDPNGPDDPPPVTVHQPGDGKDTVWNGGGAQVYLQAPDRDPTLDGNQGWDLTGYLSSGGMLAFDAKVNSAPTGNVMARIDCNYPCRGELNATALFTDPTLGDGNAHTFKIPLECFHAAGTDFTQINTPFLLFADQPFELTFANVRWLPGPVTAGAATCTNNTLSP